jgi:hypothetical protein
VAKTRRTTDWLGREKEEHISDDDKKIGETRFTTDWLGNRVQEHYKDDVKVGETRVGRDWLGRDRAEHTGAKGHPIGVSRNETDWLGTPVQRHYRGPQQVGETRSKEDWLGRSFKEHKGEFFKARSDANASDAALGGGGGDYSSSPESNASSGALGKAVLILLVLLLLIGLSLWRNRESVPATQAPTSRHSDTPASPRRLVSPPVVSVKVRRIGGVIFSYAERKWGGSSFGGSGLEYPDVDLEFWSGLVSGYATVAWKGSYSFDENSLCLTISGLRVPKTSPTLQRYYSDFGVGYDVELENATFGDGAMARIPILYRTFAGDSPQPTIAKCFDVRLIKETSIAAFQMGGEWQGNFVEGSEEENPSPQKIVARLVQQGNRLEGSMLTYRIADDSQRPQTKSKIEGWILNDSITFVKTDDKALVGVSYVAKFSKDSKDLAGTWIAGLGKGTWHMTRTGDLVGGVDEFLGPELSNPPPSKSQ